MDYFARVTPDTYDDVNTFLSKVFGVKPIGYRHIEAEYLVATRGKVVWGRDIEYVLNRPETQEVLMENVD